MKLDEYGEVENGKETYDEIGATLLTGRPVLIGWTDGVGSHHDILFVVSPHKVGNIQRGLHRSWELLYVSVIGFTTFGFDIDRKVPLYSSYVSEKLHMGDNVTTSKLTDLIIGITDAI